MKIPLLFYLINLANASLAILLMANDEFISAHLAARLSRLFCAEMAVIAAANTITMTAKRIKYDNIFNSLLSFIFSAKIVYNYIFSVYYFYHTEQKK